MSYKIKDREKYDGFLESIKGLKKVRSKNSNVIYELSQGGTVICEEYNFESSFVGEVTLAGFGSNRDKLLEIESKLEEITVNF